MRRVTALLASIGRDRGREGTVSGGNLATTTLPDRSGIRKPSGGSPSSERCATP